MVLLQRRQLSPRAFIPLCLVLAACDGAGGAGGARASDDAAVEFGPVAATALCSSNDSDGTVCSGGDNLPGLTALSVNNEALIATSQKGRGVYGTSLESQGGYFVSTDGEGLLAYSVNGYSGHFTGGRGVFIDPPGDASAPALAVNGSARLALPAATPGVIPVCGTLDPVSGLFTLTKCDDRLDKLEAEVAALEARLGIAPSDGGTP
jgi:hypothetical protein